MSPISNGQGQHIIAGLDIGSNTITCVIGQTNGHRKNLKLLGISSVPSSGIRRGSIIHRDLLIEQLEASMNEAETMASVKITKAIFFYEIGTCQIHRNSLSNLRGYKIFKIQ